jgi:magnesium transporter
LTLEDMTRLRREPDSPPHLPKAEEFPDYLFVIVNPLSPGVGMQVAGGKLNGTRGTLSTQLSAVLTEHLLITHHYQPLASIDALASFLVRHDAQAERGPDFLFHLVLDDAVDQLAPVLDFLEDELDRLEERVFGRPAPTLLPRLLRLKRVIVGLRKSMIHEREVLARLQRGDFALIDDRERHYYRNVYDHLIRFTELIEGARDMVSDLMQTHLAAVSNKLNEVMKALAMVSTVVLPMTLVAGIYGMNFTHMPELHWKAGYPFALALMALTAIGSVAFFKWKRWL